jgi:hypothetical protein
MLIVFSTAKINYQNAECNSNPELLYEPPLFLYESTTYFYLALFGTKKRLFLTRKELKIGFEKAS